MCRIPDDGILGNFWSAVAVRLTKWYLGPIGSFQHPAATVRDPGTASEDLATA
jgi:hypothetical protein